MSTELQRQALARDLARRLQLASHDEIRVVDRVLQRLELGRERYGLLDLAQPRDYRRERFEERLDALVYDVREELALEDQHRAGLREEARVEMLGNHTLRKPRGCRCHLEAGDSACPVHPLPPEELAYAASIGAPYVELLEWQADQHATRASDVPARIAAADLDEDEPYAGFEIGGEGG